MTEESAGNAWLRDERRRKADPEDRREGRVALQRRLFGKPDDSEELADDNPDDGPNAA